jgi:magnesium transporter
MLSLNPITDKLKNLFLRSDDLLRGTLAALQPEELANFVNGLGEGERQRVLRLISDEKFAHVLPDLSPHARAQVLSRLKSERVMALVATLESDEAADLIQELSPRVREQAIAALKRSDPKKILPLLGHEQETAGGLMKSEVLRIEEGKTIEEARKIIGEQLNHHKAVAMYVTAADGLLLGSVSLVRLASATSTYLIGEVMQKAEPVPVTMAQEDVLRLFSERDAVEMPVVDQRGKLLGIITADDVIDVMESEFSEDVAHFSGVSEDEHITDPTRLIVRRRLPWLVVNLATAILAAWVVSLFQDTISEFIILAAMMPIVAGMGGNAVTQTLGVSIRAIALDELHSLNSAKVIARQVLAGAMNGLATGVIMAVVAYVWTKDIRLSFVLIAAMTVNMLIAGFGGVIIPVAMKRLRIDPALASTVFATTLTDVVGFFAFLGMASTFL